MLAQEALVVHLDTDEKRRLEAAARLLNQSVDAFVKQAADARARGILLNWAIQRYREGDTTFSMLAGETGLSVEEIMIAMGSPSSEEALERFLARCRQVAEMHGTPRLREPAETVVGEMRTHPYP